MFNKLINTNAVGGGSTTEWIGGDESGNLFYTEDVTGLTGWADTGVSFGSGRIFDAVFTGSVWISCGDNGIWQTSDVTALSGWTQVAGDGIEFDHISWTPQGIVVGGVNKNVLYTTDATGATGWATYPNLSSTAPKGYYGVANDGSQTFFGLRADGTGVEEYAYANDLFASSSITYQNTGNAGNFSRSVFYDPINGYYFVLGALDTSNNLRYQTTLGGSFTSVLAGADSSGYGDMTYNGTYYAVINGNDVEVYYSTTSTSGYSTNALGSSLGWDRIGGINWNGTSWGAGGRYTSGNNVFAFINNTSPAGAWTGVSAPTGFVANRSQGVFPSKRPYYNAITNLGF